MSTLKHIDEDGISRTFDYSDISYPSKAMDKSIIDDLVNNGTNLLLYSSLSDAFCAINECLMGSQYYGGEWPAEAIDEIEKLLLMDYPDSYKGIRYDSTGVECFYVLVRKDQIGLCPSIPNNYHDSSAWEINSDECTAILACDDGSQFLIELSQQELEYILPDEDEYYGEIREVNEGLDQEEDIPYFFSYEETQFIKSDLKLKITAINDILRKYDEKYMLKIKQ